MRPLPRLLLVITILLLALVASPRRGTATGESAAAPDPWSYPHVPSELLVGFRSSAPFGAGGEFSAAFDRFLSGFGVRTAGPGLGDGRTFRLQFGAGADLRDQQRALLADPGVAYAEPNYLLTIQAAPTGPLKPNDENYPQQWGPSKVMADLTWNTLTTGGPIVIAMLDTGISPTHPDLKDHLRPGYDYVNNDANPADDNGHGTFTAGIAAASGNNGIGVAGVSWGARLMPVKILDQDGRGPVSAFAQGIRYAVEQGAQIVNVSAGIPIPSQAMEAAVSFAIGKGAIVVAASGNQADGAQNYPAAYPNVIAVAASTKDDKVAEFSSYGSYVWLAAPGKDIVSTYSRDTDGYAQLSGTSAATPFVSGTIALMLSQRGTLTAKVIREILKATAVDIETPGFDPKSGYGRLDTFHAVILATDPEPTLTGATVTPPAGADSDAYLLAATGFETGEPIAVWIAGADGSYRYYRYPQVYADKAGELRVVIGTNEPLSVGQQTVTAYGERSKRVARTTFAVTKSVNTKAFERVPPVDETDSRVYFAATGHTLSNTFLRYWQSNGGLAIFGLPISEEFTEFSKIDNKPYTVQYFERNRFEYHPENAGTDYEVLLGLLGSDLTRGRKFDQALAPYESTDQRAYFPETKHSLTGDFLKYWRANGGLAVFGYPLSEPFQEISPTDGKPYLVQYFERNRFELHPENADPRYRVLLGLLGVQIARDQGNIK